MDVLGLVADISRRHGVFYHFAFITPLEMCIVFVLCVVLISKAFNVFSCIVQKYASEPDMLTVCWSLMYLSESEWVPAKEVASVMLCELSWWLHHHDDISWTQFEKAMDSLAQMLDNEGVYWHAATLRLTLKRLSDGGVNT